MRWTVLLQDMITASMLRLLKSLLEVTVTITFGIGPKQTPQNNFLILGLIFQQEHIVLMRLCGEHLRMHIL